MNYRSIFRHYWQFLRRYTKSQATLLICYALADLSKVVIIPLVYKGIIDAVTEQPDNLYEVLNFWLLVLVAMIVLENICFRVADYLLVNSQSRIVKELYDYCLEKLQQHSYTFFTNAFMGSLVAKTRRFVNAFETLHDQFIFQIWMSTISLLSLMVVLWYQFWVLGLVLLVWLIFYGVLVRFMVGWQIPKSLASAEADSQTTAHYSDIIGNIFTVKMFGTERREKRGFAQTTTDQEQKRTRAWMQQAFWNSAFQSAVVGIFNIVIIWVAIELWKTGAITAGTIVLVQVYVITSFDIVWRISRNVIRIATALSEADEMVQLLDRPNGVEDPVNPESVQMTVGRVEFREVTFNYERSWSVFSDLALSIEPGQRVALVGHSGSGKSTLVKLLLRFVDIQSGSILIDGQDITRLRQSELRRQIAYVPQEPLLFHRSIRDNIAYAKPEASEEEIKEVARRAQAYQFIEALPEGNDSLVGEKGIKLSGGERQRIAIARAMLKDAPIVVLDEATSSLDSISEEKIQTAFKELMAGRTTIVIAHRLSTIKHMDRIVVFDHGRVVESGTHEELVDYQGVYGELWASQVGGFIQE